MMNFNDTYQANLSKVKDCIAFKNNHVLSCYQGPEVVATYSDISLAEYENDPQRGSQYFIDFVEKINEIAPINCINSPYLPYMDIPLSLLWWSKIKMPGVELDENSIWQVQEMKLLEDDDYKLIIKQGSQAVANKVLLQIMNMDRFDLFMNYATNIAPGIDQKIIDVGIPIVANTTECPPFETLSGGRSMSKFFMDCYKKMDEIKEAQDVMLEEILTRIKNTPYPDYQIGAWVGGWRGASALVSPKIWDNLVWPYMYKISMALIDKGITPILHLDQKWDRDLERFKELPEKKCILNTDGMTDLRLARKKLGEHVAFMGDVPSQMMTVSAPNEIKDYFRKLLDDIGTKGVFITAGCDAPVSSKYENLVAIHEVAQEY